MKKQYSGINCPTYPIPREMCWTVQGLEPSCFTAVRIDTSLFWWTRIVKNDRNNKCAVEQHVCQTSFAYTQKTDKRINGTKEAIADIGSRIILYFTGCEIFTLYQIVLTNCPLFSSQTDFKLYFFFYIHQVVMKAGHAWKGIIYSLIGRTEPKVLLNFSHYDFVLIKDTFYGNLCTY